MSVHYKFKSGKEKHTVIFDGLHISVADLKKAIMQQRKIGKSADLDLQISNPQTGEVYETDSTLIPKNTSVEVARVPNSSNQKKSWDRHETNSSKGANSPSHIEVDKITKSSNLSTSYGTEDEKIKAMMSQSTQEYDPSKYVKNRGIIGPLPSNYTCYRCGQPGHYIKQCPTNNSDVKRSTGIPRSFMIPAKADQKGALLTASGDYAVPIIDHEAYKEVKKEKPPFLPNSDSDKEVGLPEIPEDLMCSLCQNLLQDAVLIPCCGNSYCDECVRTILLESENHECPTCHEINVSPDNLIPNRFLRISVAKFRNDTGYKKDKYVVIDYKNDEIKQSLIDTKEEKVDYKDVIETKTDVEMKNQLSPRELKSPIQDSSDVTMDEVILGSPKKEELTKKPDEPQSVIKPTVVSNEVQSQDLKETNDGSNEEGNDSQQEAATGSNTPLVDEPSESYETTEEQSNQTEVNTILTLPHYQNQPLLTIPVYPRPPRMIEQIRAIRTLGPQQSNPTLLGRPPAILPHPRGVYPRPGFTQDSRFYRPMGDPRAFHMGLSHMPPYGYAPQLRPMAYHDPYGYMGPRSHLPTAPMHHSLSLHPVNAEAPPPGTSPLITDNMYTYSKPEYDDYEDRLNRFTRHLESKSRRKSRSITRSRSRSHSLLNRSRSSSESSSSSSSSSSRSSRFSFSSRSFSSSSRSYSPRRRSRSRDRYRRRSRSISPRHNYNRNRYRRSRSPHYHDSRRYGRSRRGFENDRERDNKYRDNRTNRYERNDNSYRTRRSDDRVKDSKQTHSSRCAHKSSQEKVETREKQSESHETGNRNRSKTPLKDENDKEFDIKETDSKPEVNKDETQDVSDAKMPTINESHIEVNDKTINQSENDKTEENETKDRNEKKKEKEKPKKHHKHHHHHHHRHRKGSVDSKNGKASDESKISSKKKHKHKKHKPSETVNKTKPNDDLKDDIKDNSEEFSRSDLKSSDNSREADIHISNSNVIKEYETDFDLVEQNKSELNNDVMFNNINELNVENSINNYESYDAIDSKEDIKSSNFDICPSDLPIYYTVEFSTDTHKEVNKETEVVVNKVQLVDYTDNEDLAEPVNDFDSNLNQLNKIDSEDNGKTKNENQVEVEVPKSKWDEDFNDLRFEEEYSDFEESQKSEYEPQDVKSSRDPHIDKCLPNEIIQKAEKAILEKPLRAAIVEKRDKKSKTSKFDEEHDKRRDKNTDKDRKERERITNSDHSSNSSSKSGEKSGDKSGEKDVKNNELMNDSLPRKVKLDRSKFAEKPTLSITINNSDKDKNKNNSRNSRTSNRIDDKDSKQSRNSPYRNSSRDRSKDRSRSDTKSSKDRKETSKEISKSSKTRDESRHRSHKRSKRSRSRSSSLHKRSKYKRESQKKSKSKSDSISSKRSK